MNIKNIDKSKEYTFEDALKKLMRNRNVVITSKNTNDSYLLENSKKGIKIKYYNNSVKSWVGVDYVLTKEIFGTWYVTE